jgi:hypothetical protein
MPQLLDLPNEVLLKLALNWKKLLNVVQTCRHLNALFTPKVYESVRFYGGFENTKVTKSFLSFVRTIVVQPKLGQLVRRLSLYGWHHYLTHSNPIVQEIIKASGEEIEDWSNSVVENLGRLILSRLPQLRELNIDYLKDVKVLRSYSFNELVDVALGAEDCVLGENNTGYFEDAVHLLSLPRLLSFSVTCPLIGDSDALKILPPRSSHVEDMTINARHISKTSLQLLLSIPKSLKRFEWSERMWTCFTELDGNACTNISNDDIAECLDQVKDSLEELWIGHAGIKMCPHDTGILDRLHEFPQLSTMYLTPQLLLGWHSGPSPTKSASESPRPSSYGPISALLPRNLTQISLQAWAEGEVLESFIRSVVGGPDPRPLKRIEVDSFSVFDRTPVPDYALRARKPLRRLKFDSHMRLFRECQAAGITLLNDDFDYHRERVVEADVLEGACQWIEEEMQYRNLWSHVLLTRIYTVDPWSEGFY